MSEASFASLGPTLLARKGGAKPAMRPQLAPLPGVNLPENSGSADQMEDLGWNDMGQDGVQDTTEATPAETPQAANTDEMGTESPLVHTQQVRLAERIIAETRKPSSETQPAANQSAPKIPRRRTAAKGRAAFTLRLDRERHLKLRLAATMKNMSAQAFVTEALDAMLAEIDDLDALAKRFNARAKPTTN